MRHLLAVFLISGLVFVPAAGASSCAGADPCPWTHVESFGEVQGGEFRAPYGIGTDDAGNLYVVENDMNRVQELGSSGGFLAKWGSNGSGAGEFSSPTDVAVDAAGGGVYVADTYNHRVEKFGPTGKFVSAWGWGVADGANAYQICTTACRAGKAGAAAGAFSNPSGIATDGVNVYVADMSNERIQKFDLGGSVLGGWTMPGGQIPQRVAVSAGKVYVSSGSDAVWRFDTNGVPDSGWDGDGVTGSTGSAQGQFDHPRGIAVDGTGVYVADSRNDRVEKFDLSGAFKKAWGGKGSGAGQFEQPVGVVAGGGVVWVTDAYNHRLQRFDQSGAHQLTVGAPLGPGDFYWPSDVATTPGGDVYVSDWGSQDVQRLDASGAAMARWSTAPGSPASVTPTAGGVYAAEGTDRVSLYSPIGSLLSQFGSSGSGQGQFDFLAGSAVDGNGNVYVADRQNNRVQKLDPAGAPLAVFGSVGTGDGQLRTPLDVALDSVGNVYAADSQNNRIEKFSPSGEFLAKWGGPGSGDGQFNTPRGLAIDSRGHVFVSDDGNGRIQEFDSSGHFVTKWGTRGGDVGQLARPEGLSVDSAGAVWVADQLNNRVVRFCCPAAGKGTPSGTGPAPVPQPAPGGATDTTAPRIKLSGRRVQRSRLVRRRGLALRIATSERATTTVRATLSRRQARGLGLHTRSIGRVTAAVATGRGRGLRVRLTARSRKAVLHERKVRVVLRASALDAAGNRATASFSVSIVRSR